MLEVLFAPSRTLLSRYDAIERGDHETTRISRDSRQCYWVAACRARAAGGDFRRVAVLLGTAESDQEAQSLIARTRRRLEELGWSEGRNIRLEVRWSTGDNNRLQFTRSSWRN
jgi:hypothetical protein